MKSKVIIVDDHTIFREGFKLVLDTIAGVKVVGEAANGRELLSLMEHNKPDLVFMDINMPLLNGVEATKKALKINPEIKIIALSSFDDIDSINNMLYAGVEGYLVKDADYTEIEKAIDDVMSGKNFFSNSILVKLTVGATKKKDEAQKKESLPELTKREQEILQLLCKGSSKSEIADKLHISERTVEKHKENLLSKTGTNNTVNLVLFALKHKMAEL
jgi:DNA-binding NarL/FixJ family response regulator